MGELGGDLHFKIGEVIEVRGSCFGDRKINCEEYTQLTGKLDDATLNQTLQLMAN